MPRKPPGELRVINDLDALEELLEQIEIWLQAKQRAAFAARDRGEGLEIAELDIEDYPSPAEQELGWVRPDQVVVVKSPQR